jgi:hypothetical protein
MPGSALRSLDIDFRLSSTSCIDVIRSVVKVHFLFTFSPAKQQHLSLLDISKVLPQSTHLKILEGTKLPRTTRSARIQNEIEDRYNCSRFVR